MELRKVLFLIAAFLMLLGAHPSAATCSCGSGASSSYNFLGDPSFDIDMMSLDGFSQAPYLANKQENSASADAALDEVAPDRAKKVKAKGATNSFNLSLDLDDGNHIDLILFPAGKDLFGRGDMAVAQGHGVERMGAVGALDENRLILELASLGGALYRFDLLRNGDAVLGDYIKVTSDGKAIQGTARGGPWGPE
jgi:hypothetical protein